MDVIFLGGVFPKHLEQEIIENSKGPIDYAANNLQWAIISGLELCNNKPVQLCNLMLVGSYPFRYKKIKIKNENFSHKPGSSDNNLGYINLCGLSLFFRFLSGTKGLIKMARKNPGKKTIVIYEIHTPFLLASVITQYLIPGTILCLIVPDLPEFMSDNRSILYQIFKAIDKCIIDLCLLKINAFVLLTDFMIEKLNVRERPWICMEGIYDNSIMRNKIALEGNKKVILYTGQISARFGIINLLDAFNLTKKVNYELWICGEGDTRDEILRRIEKDSRIKYFGMVSRERVLLMQQNATVLVNPRTSEGDFTKYSFPSKIMEYFASGTPTIMHRLPGIPEEYYSYCFVVDPADAESLFKTMVKVCGMNQMELNEIGRKAQNFIFEQKNPKKQAGKIFEMISKL